MNYKKAYTDLITELTMRALKYEVERDDYHRQAKEQLHLSENNRILDRVHNTMDIAELLIEKRIADQISHELDTIVEISTTKQTKGKGQTTRNHDGQERRSIGVTHV